MVNVLAASLFVLLAASSQVEAAQASTPSPIVPQSAETQDRQAPETLRLSGPRVGVTFLSDGVINKLRDEYDVEVGSAVTQFGWQFEKRFYASENGATAVTEWVFLIAGLDQGVALPSLSWLMGFRTTTGLEFAVGPNFSPAGSAVAVAAGVSMRMGRLNVPVNLAVVPSRSGVRVSLLAGFNSAR